MSPPNGPGPEGRLEVLVRWDGERVVTAVPLSTRPVEACRVIIDRTGREALAIVPLLFSLCARAQTAAAALALAAAGDTNLRRTAETDRAVAVESVLESLWRLLHDLPRALGETARVEAFADVRRELLASLGAAWADAFPAALARLEMLLGTEVVGHDGPGEDADEYDAWLDGAATPVARWLGDLDASGYGAWGQGATPLMPARPGGEALRRLAERLVSEPGFARRPDWQGRPVETGALALRQEEPLVQRLRGARGHSCATRLAARLVDLRRLVDGLAGRAPLDLCGNVSLGDRSGLGWVQTARGLLLHHATLDASGRIAGYRVLAPTEWNFHPSGALARGLEAQPVASEAALRRGVGLAVLALDPCVAFDVALEPDRVAAGSA
ncbi:MAG: hypothetical protein R3298_06650 [Gammaproteobacteria bacterium]|nr:hypothetical protein [Gammaproteobacteria bacterium]